MGKVVKDIPEVLVYEMNEGKPIYYRGYKEFLDGKLQFCDIKGSSYLQSIIVTRLLIELSQKLDLGIYELLTNELGLHFGEKSWRAADLAIYEKKQLRDVPKHDTYLHLLPKVVIEIDTKASLEDMEKPLWILPKEDRSITGFWGRKSDMDFQ